MNRTVPLYFLLAAALPLCGCAKESAVPNQTENASMNTSALPALQTDTFPTPNGKEVVITAIKHASLRIQYDGLNIRIRSYR